MGSLKLKRGARAAYLVAALAVAAVVLMPAAASASGTANVQVTVSSGQASAGSVAVTNITDTTTYGTCDAPTSPGSNTCTIGVPSQSGVLLIAQPASGEMLGVWSTRCTGAPGPVCHLQSGPNGMTTPTAVTLVPASGPSASASPVYVSGPTPNSCSAAEPTTVSGSGFAASTAATLSDDGVAVASSTTDGSGNVSFPYTPAASEPGIYRALTITVGGQSAGTDVYNSGRFCITTTSSAPGMDTLTVNVSGLDANSSYDYVQVRGQSPTAISTDSTGAGSATTPAFSCAAGSNVFYQLYGQRGVGTAFRYSFSTGYLTYPC